MNFINNYISGKYGDITEKDLQKMLMNETYKWHISTCLISLPKYLGFNSTEEYSRCIEAEESNSLLDYMDNYKKNN